MERCNEIEINTFTDDCRGVITKSKCVTVQESIWLGINEGSSLEEFLFKLIEKIKNQETRIKQLEDAQL